MRYHTSQTPQEFNKRFTRKQSSMVKSVQSYSSSTGFWLCSPQQRVYYGPVCLWEAPWAMARDCPDPGAVCTRWEPFMRNGLTLVCGSEGYVVFLNCFKKKQWHILSSETLIYSDFFPLLDFLTPSSNYFRQVTTFPFAYLGGMLVLPPQVRSRWRFFVHIPH